MNNWSAHSLKWLYVNGIQINCAWQTQKQHNTLKRKMSSTEISQIFFTPNPSSETAFWLLPIAYNCARQIVPVSSYSILCPHCLNQSCSGCFKLLLEPSLTYPLWNHQLFLVTMNVPNPGFLFSWHKITKSFSNHFCDPLKVIIKCFLFHTAFFLLSEWVLEHGPLC